MSQKLRTPATPK